MKMAISVSLLAAVLLSLCVSCLHSAPSKREDSSNSCQNYTVDPNRSPGDRLYDALYISKKLTWVSILAKTEPDDKLKFYQSLERIAKGALSEEINANGSVAGKALKEVATQLATDICTWAVHNETVTLIVNCSDLTDIVRCATDRKAELIETLYQDTPVEAVSLAAEILPDIKDLMSEVNRTVDKVVESRKAWVAEYISGPECQTYVCSVA